MKFLRSLAVGVWLLLMGVLFTAPALAAPPSQANLLANPGFEGGQYAFNGDGALLVPEGWTPWWNTGQDRPRFNPAEAGHRVREGRRAASYWEQYRDYDGGLYQKVNVTPGTTYRFTAWGHAWCTTDTAKTSSDSHVKMQIGIDPNGGDNPFASSVVWSGELDALDTYQQFTVEATAAGGQITVFLRGSPDYPVTQTDIYWDDTSLVAIGQASPTQPSQPRQPTSPPPNQPPQVPAGSIPQSTPAPDGSVVHTVKAGEYLIGIAVTYGVSLEELRQLNNLATDMIFVGQQLVIRLPSPPPQPTPEPVTPTPVPEVAEATSEVAEVSGNGTICIMSYEDANGNGIREPDETKLGGITFVVNNGTQIVGQYTTDGVSEPYCFGELPAGTYIVSWTGDQYVATTEQTWATSVTPGSTVSREFGAQSIGAAAEEAEQGGGRSGLPAWMIALIGALGVMLFLGGLGAAGYFLLMRQMQKI